MNSFKSFVKNIADKAPDLAAAAAAAASSPARGLQPNSGGGVDRPGNGEAEGFICPLCMLGFLSPDLLQDHFQREHPSPSPPSTPSMCSPDVEDKVRDLQTTLREEQLHSAELKREVERLSRSVSGHESGRQPKPDEFLLAEDERALMEAQISALEEGKTLLKGELEELRKQLEKVVDERSKAKGQLVAERDKVAELVRENVALKSLAEELRTEQRVAVEKVSVLESVMKQRNSVEELEKAQRLLQSDLNEIKAADEVSRKGEVDLLRSQLDQLRTNHLVEVKKMESERIHLAEDRSALGAEKTKLETSLNQLKVQLESNSKELERAKSQCKQLHDEVEERASQLASCKTDLDETRTKSKADVAAFASKVVGLEAKVSALAEKLNGRDLKLKDTERAMESLRNQHHEQCSLSEQLQEKVAALSTDLDGASRLKDCREVEVAEVKEKLAQMGAQISKLKGEREDLLAKIQDGEGISTALVQLRDQNAALSGQVEALTADRAKLSDDFNASVNDLHRDLNETKASLTLALDKNKRLESVKDDLNRMLTEAAAKEERLQSELETKTSSMAAKEAEVAGVLAELEARIFSLDEALRSKGDECKKVQGQLKKLEGLLSEEKAKGADLAAVLSDKAEKQKADQASIVDLNSQLQEKNATIKCLEDEKSALEEAKVAFELANVSMAEKVKKASEVNSKLTADLAETRSKLETCAIDLEKLEVVRVRLLEESSKAKEYSDKVTRDLTESSKKHQAELQSALKSQAADFDALTTKLKEELGSSSEEVENLRVSVQDKTNLVIVLNSKTEEMEKSLDAAHGANSVLAAEKTQALERLREIQLELEQEKAEVAEKTADLANAKEMLLSSKLELQKQQEGLEAKVKAGLDEVQRVSRNATESENRLKRNIRELEDKLEQRDQARKALEAAHSTEVQELVASRATATKELAESSSRLEEMASRMAEINANLDAALSNRLELEAKVESTSDEVRTLLERCLAAESELERNRGTVVELRRKLDDSQAALHELGRENQSIQVELAKQTGRKWADDAETNECLACKSMFTITNRKHHCRNCGQIFCHDCSAKLAMMTTFKKPQRVCDPCHAELQLGK